MKRDNKTYVEDDLGLVKTTTPSEKPKEKECHPPTCSCKDMSECIC